MMNLHHRRIQNVSMNTAKWALNTAAKDAFCAVKKTSGQVRIELS